MGKYHHHPHHHHDYEPPEPPVDGGDRFYDSKGFQILAILAVVGTGVYFALRAYHKHKRKKSGQKVTTYLTWAYSIKNKGSGQAGKLSSTAVGLFAILFAAGLGKYHNTDPNYDKVIGFIPTSSQLETAVRATGNELPKSLPYAWTSESAAYSLSPGPALQPYTSDSSSDSSKQPSTAGLWILLNVPESISVSSILNQVLEPNVGVATVGVWALSVKLTPVSVPIF